LKREEALERIITGVEIAGHAMELADGTHVGVGNGERQSVVTLECTCCSTPYPKLSVSGPLDDIIKLVAMGTYE
jgi:hypothetical protein